MTYHIILAEGQHLFTRDAKLKDSVLGITSATGMVALVGTDMVINLIRIVWI